MDGRAGTNVAGVLDELLDLLELAGVLLAAEIFEGVRQLVDGAFVLAHEAPGDGEQVPHAQG